MQMKLVEFGLRHGAQYNLTQPHPKRCAPFLGQSLYGHLPQLGLRLVSPSPSQSKTHHPFTHKEGNMVIGAIVFMVVLGTILFALLSFSGLLDSNSSD